MADVLIYNTFAGQSRLAAPRTLPSPQTGCDTRAVLHHHHRQRCASGLICVLPICNTPLPAETVWLPALGFAGCVVAGCRCWILLVHGTPIISNCNVLLRLIHHRLLHCIASPYLSSLSTQKRSVSTKPRMAFRSTRRSHLATRVTRTLRLHPFQRFRPSSLKWHQTGGSRSISQTGALKHFNPRVWICLRGKAILPCPPAPLLLF